MANWFECKVRYDKLQENGAAKKVTEPYLVDAMSFTEAEARITEEQTPFISGEFSVSAVKRTKISEIFLRRERRQMVPRKGRIHHHRREDRRREALILSILVQATSFKNAYDNFIEGMKGTMADYEIAQITETPLMDVYRMKVVE